MAIDLSKTENFEERNKKLKGVIRAYQGQNDCLANALRRLGLLYKNNGQSDSAIKYFLEAHRYSVKAKDKLSQASNLNQIATVYVEQKNFRQAMQYFRMAFEAYSQLQDFRGMSDATYNLAEMQFELNQRDSACNNCLLSLGYMRRWGDTSTVGYNYDLLSRHGLVTGMTERALQFSKTAINLFQREEDVSGMLPALSQTGKVFEKMGRIDSALAYFIKSFRLSDRYGYRQHLSENAGLIAATFEKLNQPDSAIRYLKLKQAISDSLHNQVRDKNTTEMLTRFDTEKKELALEAEKQTSANRKAMNTALLITAALLALFMLLMWRSFRQQKKIKQKESELNQANALLRGQDAERERIARELHDRVGSMLSTVKLHFTGMESQMSDLITQQSNTYQKALHLLDETYEEVRRISHDLDTGLLGRYGLRTAMLQLTQLISSANKVKVQYIDNNLPPELYQPFETELYRITQELLSNTIKYAGASEASIQISRNNGNLIYSYEDDGIGFSKPQLEQAKGLGYKNIEARVQKLNAQWHLDTSPGNGVNLIIEIPLAPNQHNHR